MEPTLPEISSITNDPHTFSQYKNLRNRVISMLRKGKQAYMRSLQSTNAKQFWRAVKILNGKSSSSIPVLRCDGEEACTDHAKATMLNNYFSSCFNQSLPPLSESSDLSHTNSQECPDDLLCTEEEVLKLLLSLDVTKSIVVLMAYQLICSKLLLSLLPPHSANSSISQLQLASSLLHGRFPMLYLSQKMETNLFQQLPTHLAVVNHQ